MTNLNILLMYALLISSEGVRINFTSCQNAGWSCFATKDIVYSCANVKSNDFIIHLKDFYTDDIKSLTVQNCKDVKVVLDCPILQKASSLQKFKVKDCDKLQFISLSNNSPVQTPPEVTIENVKEVVSLPRKFFRSPTTANEVKCSGTASLKSISVVDSYIKSINTRAIYNVTGVSSVEFVNVTIGEIQNQGIEAILGNEDTLFSFANNKIESLRYKGVAVQCTSAFFTENTFRDVLSNSLNVTADNLSVVGNKFKQVNGLILKASSIEISKNEFGTLKSNAFTNVKCLRRNTGRRGFTFALNTVENVEPHSLVFDYASCKTAGASVTYENNKIDCRCRDIDFLDAPTELNSLILDLSFNNTCLSAPCLLPVEIVKLLLERGMCDINLDPQIMCLLYGDRHLANNELTTDEDVTEPTSTFYIIRQADPLDGGASSLTAINKDELLRDSHFNITNRTSIRVVFDSSRDFVETLRGTDSSRKKTTDKVNEEYTNRCVGPQCRNNAVQDKQKALDFYKFIYSQLRQPRANDKKKKKR
ncbi:uncharacterized protein LOC101746938 [Bombyx mori]|uniref:Uncharacterized protein n=1 Tax=Bombyx mori TaxID=7091 RepID=A0A8R2ALA4_BOMMO|nr:uncharacterized protein LOC101746938 [Bombyx mori]